MKRWAVLALLASAMVVLAIDVDPVEPVSLLQVHHALPRRAATNRACALRMTQDSAEAGAPQGLATAKDTVR